MVSWIPSVAVLLMELAILFDSCKDWNWRKSRRGNMTTTIDTPFDGSGEIGKKFEGEGVIEMKWMSKQICNGRNLNQW